MDALDDGREAQEKESTSKTSTLDVKVCADEVAERGRLWLVPRSEEPRTHTRNLTAVKRPEHASSLEAPRFDGRLVRRRRFRHWHSPGARVLIHASQQLAPGQHETLAALVEPSAPGADASGRPVLALQQQISCPGPLPLPLGLLGGVRAAAATNDRRRTLTAACASCRGIDSRTGSTLLLQAGEGEASSALVEHDRWRQPVEVA